MKTDISNKHSKFVTDIGNAFLKEKKRSAVRCKSHIADTLGVTDILLATPLALRTSEKKRDIGWVGDLGRNPRCGSREELLKGECGGFIRYLARRRQVTGNILVVCYIMDKWSNEVLLFMCFSKLSHFWIYFSLCQSNSEN